MTSNSARVKSYHLDHRPSAAQRRLLWHLAEGHQVALTPEGKYLVLQTNDIVSQATVFACLNRQWISALPGFPLFDVPARITPRGLAALGRS
jgi:hypothetical protein